MDLISLFTHQVKEGFVALRVTSQCSLKGTDFIENGFVLPVTIDPVKKIFAFENKCQHAVPTECDYFRSKILSGHDDDILIPHVFRTDQFGTFPAGTVFVSTDAVFTLILGDKAENNQYYAKYEGKYVYVGATIKGGNHTWRKAISRRTNVLTLMLCLRDKRIKVPKFVMFYMLAMV